ncbi:peptidoglycan bridge formation glycyltransferase FemA/FemB family protein [Candidatus Peregrinibacteria bacterium]|nr:peptidoglycan bridge formation glycyltransferase FemA/FemB family protein [Candidatus Peregrinibacteria bacterium]
MLKSVFFTPSSADTLRVDNFVKKIRGDVQQSADGGAMFHAGDGLRYCLGVEESGELVATMNVYVRRLPFGLSWLYCPRGPVWKKSRKNVWNVFFREIQEIARRERAIFLRVEPDEKMHCASYAPDPTHPWAGISDFKLKFGGTIFRYHPAVEYVFSRFWYALFLFAKRFRTLFSRATSKFASGDIAPFWKDCGFRLAHGHYQPEYTNMIDLSLSEVEILAQMKPKGRYNIRLAEKRGVKVLAWQWDLEREVHDLSFLKASAAADIFYHLFSETTGRDGFSGHEKEFYENFLRLGGGECGIGKMYVAYVSVIPDGKVALATAPDQESLQTTKVLQDPRSETVAEDNSMRRARNEIASVAELPRNDRNIAAIIVTSFGDRATYFYGASSNFHRELMALYLLQWTAILDAKKEGLRWYDLFGIATGK